MMKMDTIYCYNPLFNYLVNMFCHNGKPLPGNYVTANKDFSNKYIYNINDDIHSKKSLQHFSGQYFFPETFFSMERFNSTKTDSLFFLKSYLKDNASGIKILDHKSVPPLVPNNHLLQTEIKSKLYNQRKFDIRVLLCVKRTGDIMIYKNLLYRINPNIFVEQKDNPQLSNYLTNTVLFKDMAMSFFDKLHPNEFDTKDYLQQISSIVPIIYSKLLPISNSGYPHDIEHSFMFGGLDFIPRKQDNKLFFMELNLTPGWNRDLGIENYQKFYQLATNFILGKDQNTDDCIYISLSDLKEKV